MWNLVSSVLLLLVMVALVALKLLASPEETGSVLLGFAIVVALTVAVPRVFRRIV